MAVQRLLVMAGDPDAARRTAAYTGRVIGGKPGFEVWLADLLPPLPPKLLEFGGRETPREEAQAEAALKAAQARWLAQAREKAAPGLEDARRALEDAGVPAGAIHTETIEVIDGTPPAELVRDFAREHGCSTIVVARETTDGDEAELAEDLADADGEFAVWIVDGRQGDDRRSRGRASAGQSA